MRVSSRQRCCKNNFSRTDGWPAIISSCNGLFKGYEQNKAICLWNINWQQQVTMCSCPVCMEADLNVITFADKLYQSCT